MRFPREWENQFSSLRPASGPCQRRRQAPLSLACGLDGGEPGAERTHRGGRAARGSQGHRLWSQDRLGFKRTWRGLPSSWGPRQAVQGHQQDAGDRAAGRRHRLGSACAGQELGWGLQTPCGPQAAERGPEGKDGGQKQSAPWCSSCQGDSWRRAFAFSNKTLFFSPDN